MIENASKKTNLRIKMLYEKKRMSLKAISKMYRRSVPQDIKKVLIEEGVEIRKRGTVCKLPPGEVLIKEIGEMGKKSAVAVKYGVTDGAITHALERYYEKISEEE